MVSCIMPTFNRRPFVPHALDYFLRQDYPRRELIIIDDGQDEIGDLVKDVPDVRYVRLHARASIGAKRNLA
jgi:glycosyltransferase involved in cell wall biosynthesis